MKGDSLTSRQLTGGVNRTPIQTACTGAHSVSAHTLNSMITFITRTRVAQERTSSRLHALVSKKKMSSTSHVSFLAATSPIFPTISPSHPSPLAHDPYFTLRRFTAEWRINSNPISYKTHCSDKPRTWSIQHYPCPPRLPASTPPKENKFFR